MHWNVSIGPDKWLIFGRFLTLFQLKRARQKYLQYGGRQSMTSSRDVTASPQYNGKALHKNADYYHYY
jgi:hypothetical protein